MLMLTSQLNLSAIRMVLQKEYIITEPTSDRFVIGTGSLRGCYGITVYHQTRSCLIHWDDDVNHGELDKAINEFLKSDLNLSECEVNIAGGWENNQGSLESGNFILQYFSERNIRPSLKGFQEKREVDNLIASTFEYLLLDTKTGEITLKDLDNQSNCLMIENLGPDAQQRISCFKHLLLTHCQDKKFPDSGSPLIPFNHFNTLMKKEYNILCQAAQNNDVNGLINCLDHGITDISLSIDGKSGWTPLHFACKARSYQCAEILISHGANLQAKTNKGTTPLEFITNKVEKQKLEELSQYPTQWQEDNTTAFLTIFAISYRHKERVKSLKEDNPDLYQYIKSIKVKRK